MFQSLKDLNEALSSAQLNKIVDDLGFGLELEVVSKFPRIKLDKMYAILEAKSFIDFFKKLLLKTPSKYDIQDFNEFLEIDNFTEILKELKSILFEYGTPFIGQYHNLTYDEKGNEIETNKSTTYKCWRIETDNTIPPYTGGEIITPSPTNKGLSYEKVLDIIPRLTNILTLFGFGGADETTGLHIHISYNKVYTYKAKEKTESIELNHLNANAFATWIKENKEKYNLFALACYLNGHESEEIFLKGEPSRAKASYSLNFIATINQFIMKNKMESHVYPIILSLGIFSKNIPILNKEISYQIPVSPFINKDFPVNILEFINSETVKNEVPFAFLLAAAEHYLDEVAFGSHNISVSAREQTIEIRGFGGEKAFKAYAKKEGLKEILNIAISQCKFLLPTDYAKIDKQEMLENIKHVMDETIIYWLNILLVDLENLKRHTSIEHTLMETASKLNFKSDSRLIKFLVKYHNNIYIKNDVQEFDLDSSYKSIKPVVLGKAHSNVIDKSKDTGAIVNV